ncbi:MAG TPA: hemolysin family protein, partial [Victivallales bacterium]|nr:hemolysin family protein [Victivallales bacterium]
RPYSIYYMDNIVIQIILTLLFVVCSAFFSGAETALFSLSRARLLEYAGQSRSCRIQIVGLMKDYNRTLTAIVFGNMFMNSSLSISINLMISRFSHNPTLSLVISLFISLVILLIGGEVTPKAVAILNAEKVSDFAAPILWYYRKSVMPLILVAEKLHSLLWRVVGRMKQPSLTHDEYYAFVDMARDTDAFNDSEADMLEQILDFEDLRISKLVRSRMDIKCISEEMSAEEVADIIKISRQKFLPVIKDSIDDAVKMFSVRDFFRLGEIKRADWKDSDCVFEAVFIPGGTTVQKAITIFEKRKIRAALVVDEFGGVIGVLARKEIYERVFGEILEEFEKSDWQLRKIGDSKWTLKGNIMVEDVAELIPGIRLPESESATLSGMVVEALSDFPERGEVVRIGNCSVKVTNLLGNRITEFELSINQEEQEDGL